MGRRKGGKKPAFVRMPEPEPLQLLFAVSGMSCARNCGAQVQRGLASVPGVADARVSFQRRQGTVTVAADADVARIERECVAAVHSGGPSTCNKSLAVEPLGLLATTVVPVGGMTCQSCVGTVTRALEALPGVESASVSLERGEAAVTGAAPREALVDAIEAVGFSAAATTVVPVGGMTCQSCVGTVTRALEAVEGVESASVSLERGEAAVTGAAPREALVDAIEAVGFSTAATTTVPVHGMTCQSCVGTVTRALEAVEGVESVAVSLDNAEAAVTGAAPREALVDAIEAVGFSAAATATVPVHGMTRQSCVGTVTAALEAVPGVESVAVSLDNAEAAVTGAAPREALVEAIEAVGFSTEAEAEAETKEPEQEEQEEQEELDDVTIDVSGMTCSSCTSIIERVLLAHPGVSSASVALLAEKAHVRFNPRLTSPALLVGAIEGAGYAAAASAQSARGEAQIHVGGMTCQSCVGTATRALEAVPGVESASVSLISETARVRFDPAAASLADLLAAVERAGFSAAEVTSATASEARRAAAGQRWARLFKTALALTLPIVVVMQVLNRVAWIRDDVLSAELLPGLTWRSLALLVLATPVQFGCGRVFFVEAWSGVRNRALGMAFLVALGTSAAYFFAAFTIVRGLTSEGLHAANDEFFMTASMLITFVLLGKHLEHVAKGNTSTALQSLMKLQPATAVLVQPGSGEERQVPADSVRQGDLLKVVRGQPVPADGDVEQGSLHVDESMISGESMPVSKAEGDKVLAATIAVDGFALVRVTGVGADTALSQIVRLVEDAQTSKAPIQAYADYVASLFVPVVTGLSVLTFLVWLVAGENDAALLPPATSPFVMAFTFGIATLVVACPCALGLATPTAVMVGTGVGAANGILIKSGEALETAHKVSAVALDKTGTLTVGHPVVTDVVPLAELSAEELMQLVGSAEKGSEHPLAAAVVAHATDALGLALETPDDFSAETGRGMACAVRGRRVLVGNRLWMADNDVAGVGRAAEVALRKLEAQGKTVVLAAVDDRCAGLVAIADEPRPEARDVVRALEAQGIEVWMLTGDNRSTALAVAAQIGLPATQVMAEVLPSNKAAMVRKLQAAQHVVAMVGDGVNDSPALAQADLGVALATGSAIASEAADMVLLQQQHGLAAVLIALHLSRTIFGRIRMNFAWALGYNALMLPLAAGVLYPFTGTMLPPEVAGGAMALSSVSVVTSSLLLKRYRPPESFIPPAGKAEVASDSAPLLSGPSGRAGYTAAV